MTVLLAVRIEAFEVGDVETFFNYAVGSAQVLVNGFTDDDPAVCVARTLAVVLEVVEDTFAISFYALDVSPKTISLVCEDGGC